MAENVLVTGSRGYIGSVLVPMLVGAGFAINGADAGYYRDCLTGDDPAGDVGVNTDVRHTAPIFGADAIIHLAALSNDPLGELDPRLTDEINRDTTISLASIAKSAGIKRFILASSQSIYGLNESDEPLTEDAPKNPLTAYARSKWDAEQAIMELADDDFCVVALRAATVFGWSPRLRTDIVFNNMLAQAYTTSKIEVRGDGSEWRPVVHIKDLCNAYIACLEADAAKVNRQAFNVGTLNYRVSEIAEIAADTWPAEITYGERAPDTRSYRTSGYKLFTALGRMPLNGPRVGGLEMIQKFSETNFTAEDMGRKTNRLAQLQWLRETGKLDAELRWT
jgi:nucleoside-diphosphate-sugar epimerase